MMVQVSERLPEMEERDRERLGILLLRAARKGIRTGEISGLSLLEMASDGTLVFRDEIPGKGMDLKLWPDDDPESIASLMEGPDDELAATLSPDERWMAFVSDLSGQDEIYVTSFPQPKGRIQISSGGGTSPAWSKDGTEIFYARGDAMIAARVTTSPGVRVLSREQMFTGSYLQYRWYRQYDLMPDGKHFLMILNPPRGSIEMVTNWFTELDEILDLSDRVAVVAGGELIDIVDIEDTNENELGLMMTGVRREDAHE